MFTPDCAEYGQFKSGISAKGITFAIQTFSVKITAAISSSLALFLLGLFQSGLIYLCITIGAVVAKKHKLIAAIGIYYGVNTVVGLIGEFILMFLSVGIISIITAAMYAGGAVMGLTITAVLLIIALAFATLAAIVHFMALNKIEKKLNLA